MRTPLLVVSVPLLRDEIVVRPDVQNDELPENEHKIYNKNAN